jgi:hypothetical protein
VIWNVCTIFTEINDSNIPARAGQINFIDVGIDISCSLEVIHFIGFDAALDDKVKLPTPPNKSNLKKFVLITGIRARTITES